MALKNGNFFLLEYADKVPGSSWSNYYFPIILGFGRHLIWLVPPDNSVLHANKDVPTFMSNHTTVCSSS